MSIQRSCLLRCCSDEKDYNTFEPIVFDYSHQAKLTGQFGKYAMYKATFNITKDEYSYITFSGVEGYAWYYLNGKLIHEENSIWSVPTQVKLPNAIEGEQQITVILTLMQVGWQHGGIYSPVVLC